MLHHVQYLTVPALWIQVQRIDQLLPSHFTHCIKNTTLQTTSELCNISNSGSAQFPTPSELCLYGAETVKTMLLLFPLSVSKLSRHSSFYASEMRAGADNADFTLPSTTTPNVPVTPAAGETILGSRQANPTRLQRPSALQQRGIFTDSGCIQGTSWCSLRPQHRA